MLPPLFVSAFHPLSCLGILRLSSRSRPHLTLTHTVPLFYMAGCLELRFGDSTANLCSLSPPPPPLHFQSVTRPIPNTVGVQTQTGLRIRSVSNVRDSCKAGSWMVSRYCGVSHRKSARIYPPSRLRAMAVRRLQRCPAVRKMLSLYIAPSQRQSKTRLELMFEGARSRFQWSRFSQCYYSFWGYACCGSVL